LIEKFATYSGISGVQPKFLVRDEKTFEQDQRTKRTLSPSFRGATHIVKFWDPAEFPQLAANEFFCLKVAKRCGLNVPSHQLAEDGSALVMERFDLRADGTYCGFEDFCVLNARRTDEKYRGSYETNVLKRFQQFANSSSVLDEGIRLFTLIALNCAIRNGDAHLKNFGIVYDAVLGAAHLAPVYDLVTTCVYIPHDRMALTLNGSNQWPQARDLIRFGEGRSLGTRRSLTEILHKICDAIADVSKDLFAYGKEQPEFADIAKAMLREWEIGSKSLRSDLAGT
jgi:serine/threonine-protein kinase HipA